MKLIDKDALVAEIEKFIERAKAERVLHPKTILAAKNYLLIEDYSKLLSFIDTLELKEVDLDFSRFSDEMLKVASLPSSVTRNTEENPLNWEYAIAKHFFELGLKASQG